MTAAKKLAEPEIHVLPNKRILVVEDEPLVLDTYKGILENESTGVIPITRSSRSKKTTQIDRNNFEVIYCSNADQALHAIKESVTLKKPIAMGFFDVLLEGSRLDGIELVKEIFHLDSNIKAVFVTAYQDRSVDSINELLGEEYSNRWDYLNKPFSQGEILQKARNLTSVWNLEREKENQDWIIQDAQSRLMESDRFSTVAAVSRSVCHEFGNLLVHISGNAELHRNGTETEKSEAFDVILKACDTAKTILDKLKHLSQSPDFEDQKTVFDINTPLNVAIRLLEHQFQTQNIKICHIKKDTAPVFGNPNSLLQVYVNLFINSLHAMGNSGQVDISVDKRGDQVELILHDYGPGIPKEHLERITEPLFTTKGNDGTGLGLSICKEIIEIEHGGTFQIHNHSSKGAEVKIKLPVTKEEVENE